MLRCKILQQPLSIRCESADVRNGEIDIHYIRNRTIQFQERARRAGSWVQAAGFKWILRGDFSHFPEESAEPRWLELSYTLTQEAIAILLVRQSCLEHWISYHGPHHTTGKSRYAKHPKLNASGSEIVRWCEARNRFYSLLITRQGLPRPLLVVAYEALVERTQSTMGAVLRALNVSALQGSQAYEHGQTRQRFHNQPVYSYLSSPEEVRAIRPWAHNFQVSKACRTPKLPTNTMCLW